MTTKTFCIIIVEHQAGVTQWQSVRFPSRIRGFDSRHLLQKKRGFQNGTPSSFEPVDAFQNRVRPAPAVNLRSKFTTRLHSKRGLVLVSVTILFCIFLQLVNNLSKYIVFCKNMLYNKKNTFGRKIHNGWF